MTTARNASRAARYPVARSGTRRWASRRSAPAMARSTSRRSGSLATVAPATRKAVARRSSSGDSVARGDVGGSAPSASSNARRASEYRRPHAPVSPAGDARAAGSTSSSCGERAPTIVKDRLSTPAGPQRPLPQRRARRRGEPPSARYTLSCSTQADGSLHLTSSSLSRAAKTCSLLVAVFDRIFIGRRRSKLLASADLRKLVRRVRATGQRVRPAGRRVRSAGHPGFDRPRRSHHASRFFCQRVMRGCANEPVRR
jgi:hypothetical protein